MTGHRLTVLAYAVALPMPAAILAWPLVERAGRLPNRTSVLVAGVFWAGLVLPPAVGLAIDRVRAPRNYSPGAECADYVLWWFGIPLGWLLGTLVVIAAVAIGRRRNQSVPS